ncbi:hypothetical protein [Candidatus Phycosocius spiralis]|uniref:Uncharacterized protein n=1 Tax=Candidatus Phycosocius spiralis TaxID=2815099 RepID=A0ABQ4PYQ5_9PROT|nr:hypothetical protein [Candidatus Phycosocius spiralis]GIU68119.1 hypothetical protein PsB1_2273 [Candidatus Phycosocius spiralis]
MSDGIILALSQTADANIAQAQLEIEVGNMRARTMDEFKAHQRAQSEASAFRD